MPKTISQVLNQSESGLTRMLTRAQVLHGLTLDLRSIVDEPLKQHLYVANIRGNTAVIATDSTAWLTHIRYLSSLILEHLQQKNGLENLKNIEFKVQPFLASYSSDPAYSVELSAESAQSLRKKANEINDPQLSSALLRLARRHKS